MHDYRLKEIIFKLLTKPLPFRVPVHGGWLKYWRILPLIRGYEKETVAFLKQRITKDMVVADIGANLGFFTLLLSNLSKKVIAFEPDPVSFKRLTENTKALTNVEIHNKAVGVPGKQMLFGEPGRGTNSFYHRKTPIGEVEVVSGPKVDFAKIDVEGAEIDVLNNMPRCPCVIEYSPYNLPSKTYIQDLKDLGYEVWSITKDDLTKDLLKDKEHNLYIEPLATGSGDIDTFWNLSTEFDMEEK